MTSNARVYVTNNINDVSLVNDYILTAIISVYKSMTYVSKNPNTTLSQYFTEEDVTNLKNYKYHGEDAGISTYYIWDPSARWALDRTPTWLA